MRKNTKNSDYTFVKKDDVALLEAKKRFPMIYLLDLIAVDVKFKHFKRIKNCRLKIKTIYEERLGKIKALKIFKDNEDSLSILQNFVILCKERERLGKFLRKNGVIWQKPHVPLHRIRIFEKFAVGNFPVSERYADEAIQLPLYSFMDEADGLHIVQLIKGFYGH